MGAKEKVGGARLIFTRVGSFIIAALIWMITGARVVLDIVGWSTAPDDVGVALTRVDMILVWLIKLPWFVPWGFLLITTLFLMWVSWPRNRNTPLQNSSKIQPIETDLINIKNQIASMDEFDHKGVHISHIHLNFSNIWDELFVEIAIFGFNGSGVEIKYSGTSGCVEYILKGLSTDRRKLPSPSYLENRGPTVWPDKTSFLIIFEQRIPKLALSSIEMSLRHKFLEFRYENLEIQVDYKNGKALLPLPAGSSIRMSKPGDFIYATIVGGSTNLSMNIP